MVDSLSPTEKDLLYFVIRRKFLYKKPMFNERDFIKPSLKMIHRALNTHCSKKTEECYKFILGRGLGHVQDVLETKLGNKLATNSFYEIYFKEASLKCNIPVKEFQYPLTKDLKGKINLNQEYFCKLFKSERLVQDINDYLKNEIITNYTQEIANKLISLVLKWEKMYLKNKYVNQETIDHFFAEVFSQKRYKIPWSLEEVREAISKYNKLVTNIRYSRPPIVEKS